MSGFDQIPQQTLMIVWVGLIVLLLGLAALVGAMSGRGRTARRLSHILNRVGASSAGAAVAPSGGVRRDVRQSPVDDFLGRYMPNPAKLRARLESAGLSLGPGSFLLINVFLLAVSWIALSQALGRPLLASPLAVIIGVGMPNLWLSSRIRARKAKFLKQFPEAIDLIVRGLRSGLPVQESFSAIGAEMKDPIRQEFRTVAELLAIGRSMDEALWEVANKINLPEFNFFVVALSVQRETGGNLAETLDNLSDILRRRHQTKLKIKALSSEARASALIIGALPFIMFGVIMYMNPEYMTKLFEDPRGQVMLGVGLLWLGSGFAIMAKMVRFEI